MLIGYLLSTIHTFALALGFSSLWARSRILSRAPIEGEKILDSALLADNLWGLSAILWIGTGIPRAFLGFEKGTDFYLSNPYFLGKMLLLGAILILELWPMGTLVHWRLMKAKGKGLDMSLAISFARIGYIQMALLIGMVCLATAVTRLM
ncbi:hypothetical protein CH373_15675 [Leptospira perolatii]|uniref:DUF2214 domain-containing protein n=1 Tax=Leptospira perolatii TaxID=2023191 RepID=A0A2M9ZJE2_9LEPT|nr:DUF2214 family protein [Leptospira perolatii]PJZ68849.1 hypothetical protein CH360_14135 [Leptospira perolatii]PJZ72180.1 hypothetical protein CH373_15675 [Leptospira perolatii]